MNGTADPTIPYEGGRVGGPPGQDLGAVVSAQRTADLWHRRLGCGSPERYSLPDRDPDDGTRVRLQARQLDRIPLSDFGGLS